MRTFKGVIRTDQQGSECEFEFEVEDDATEDQINAEARDAAFQHVEWNYKEI